MTSREEQFFEEIIGLTSSFFYELHKTCMSYKSSGSKKFLKPLASPSQLDSGDERGGRRSKRKIDDPLKKDPKAPKRPIIQGYLLYFQQVRSTRREENPDLNNIELTKLIGQEWNDMAKEERIKYDIKAKEQKEQYYAELEKYYEENPEMREKVEEARSRGGRRRGGHGTQSQAARSQKPKAKPAPTAEVKEKALASSDDEPESEDDDASQIGIGSISSSEGSIRRTFSSDSSSESSSDSEEEELRRAAKPKKKVKK